ncbi:MAG: Fmu (Sun) domain-containing protein [Bacteroidota bacterium]
MSKYYSYLNTARELLQQYKGNEPLSSFLKKFFSLNKKYGSKDRKQISNLCYSYFRMGKMKADMPVEERIIMGLFLCSHESNEIVQLVRPGWNEKIALPLNEKLSLLNAASSFEDIFPFSNEVSTGIEKSSFILSHLQQPGVFLRLRPGKEDTAKKKLKNAEIDFQIISGTCLALPNASKIDTAIELNREAVVQDHSSQRVGEFFLLISGAQPLTVWDCCAASGGKSIMLYDLYQDIELTVSDIRESILVNLKKRFSDAGITKYKSFVADLAASDFRLRTADMPVRQAGFQFILADVPCSGSGTWSRTPEQLYYFENEKVNEYVSLQKKILANVITHLQPGGHLLYITCSVFKKENEDVVDFIIQNFNIQLIKMEVLKGYDKKADTMFAALLQKPL